MDQFDRVLFQLEVYLDGKELLRQAKVRFIEIIATFLNPRDFSRTSFKQ